MEAFIGTIMLWGPNFAPRNWAFCAGQLLSIAENNALFALIGCTYGGDCRTTFALPDLRGRVPIGAGQSPGTHVYQQGQRSGVEMVTLDTNHMPSHHHGAGTLTASMSASTQAATEVTPGPTQQLGVVTPQSRGEPTPFVYTSAAADTNLGSVALSGDTAANGGSQAFSVVQPYEVVQYIICLQGLFPPRN